MEAYVIGTTKIKMATMRPKAPLSSKMP